MDVVLQSAYIDYASYENIIIKRFHLFDYKVHLMISWGSFPYPDIIPI